MVSIPDWTRFRRGPPPPSPLGNKRAMTPRERYVRAMEKEAIHEAKQKGYFLDPEKDDIINWFGETGGVEDPVTGLPLQKQFRHVKHIRLSNQHMKLLGDVPMFTRITILILDHNYLSNIDPLAACSKDLIKLDIHSNQIPFLPDAMFWSRFQKLQILLAHDNPIGRVETIHSLNACSKLQILTLYDSPLSLKKNYRHHVVNTVWSLKALDTHVISDEEIIEDALFRGTQFSAIRKHFEVDLSPSQPKAGATFTQELTTACHVIAKVNRILAHFSPVLMIQKTVRFWLTYRRYRLYQDSRAWAAITIQRAWRAYKGLPDPAMADQYDALNDILQPASPPINQSYLHPQDSSHHSQKVGQRTKKVVDITCCLGPSPSMSSQHAMPPSSTTNNAQKNELRLKRAPSYFGGARAVTAGPTDSRLLSVCTPQASLHFASKTSRHSTTSGTPYRSSLHAPTTSSDQKCHGSRLGIGSSGSYSNTPTGSRRSRRPRKALIIDLTKLTEVSALREDNVDEAQVLHQVHMMTPRKSPGKKLAPLRPRRLKKKKRRLMTIRHFFGPIVQDSDIVPVSHRHCGVPYGMAAADHETVPVTGGYAMLNHQPSSAPPAVNLESADEVPRIAYRLKGRRKEVGQSDMFEETVLSKQEIGQDIRDMETAVHDKLAALPRRTRVKKDANIKDKHMYQRMQQTMALSCLNAVQQAYRDRDLDEQRAAKMQAILAMKEKRETAKASIKIYHEEKRTMAINSRQEDRRMLGDFFDNKEKILVQDIDKTLTKREKTKRDRKQWQAEQNFALEFRTQQTSVSKALVRHDRQSRRDQQYQNKIEKVENLKDMEKEQQDIVKKYLQHRQMLRQTENSMSRAALDTKMLQEANDRVLEAKTRVDQHKSRASRAQQYVPVPATAMGGPDPGIPQSADMCTTAFARELHNSRSTLKLTLPTPEKNDRPDTRFTMSGGNMKLVELYNKLSTA